jgi:hypothetical protein
MAADLLRLALGRGRTVCALVEQQESSRAFGDEQTDCVFQMDLLVQLGGALLEPPAHKFPSEAKHLVEHGISVILILKGMPNRTILI